MKLFITAFLSLTIITLIAQEGFVPRVYELSKAQIPNSKLQIQNSKFQNPDKAPGDTIFYEDFAEERWGATCSSNYEPLPGNAPDGYSLVDNTGNNFHWRWSDMGPRGAYTVGCEFPAEEPLYSETSGNGFLLFEADWFNTTEDCELADPYIPHDAFVAYQTLDFTGKDRVYLELDQMNRFCCDYTETTNAFFQISVNGGNQWVSYDLSPEDPNVQSVNPYRVELDLSNVAANEANVRFRFYLIGLSHYYWGIDDMLFYEPYECDLRLNDYWNDYMIQTYPTFDINDPSNDFYGGFYSQPWFIMHSYVGFRGAVENYGTEIISNVKYNVDVYRNGSLMVTHTSNPVDIQPGEKDTLEADFGNTPDGEYYEVLNDTAWSTYIKGGYEIVMYPSSESQDQNPSNDTIKETFQIADSIVSYCHTDPEKIRGEFFFKHYTAVYVEEIGLGFEVDLPDPCVHDPESPAPYYEMSSVNVFIAQQDSVALSYIDTGGVTVRAFIFKFNSENDQWEVFCASSPYEILISDINSWVTLPVLAEFSNLFYQEGGIRAVVNFSGSYVEQFQQTIKIGYDIDRKVPDKYSYLIYMSGDFGWGSGCPAITLNLHYSGEYPYTGIGDANYEALNSKIYPNPNTGTFTIEAGEKATATISNAIGTILDIFEVKEQQTVTVDYQPGVYFVQLKSKNRQAVHRLIIE